MSLVAFAATQTVDVSEVTLLDYEDGGLFVVHAVASDLGGGENLTLAAYTKVHQGADERLHSTATISGTASDPNVLTLGPVVSKESTSFTAVLNTGSADCPWWVESLGLASSVEDGEGDLLADATEQTLVEVLYPGLFLLLVDVAVMASGDDLKLRLKTRRGATWYTEKYVLLEDAQTNGIYALGPIDVPEAVRATLEQSAGTVETWPWALVKLG